MLPRIDALLLALIVAWIPSVQVEPAREDRDPAALATSARRAEERGELAVARADWLTAGTALPFGVDRDAAVAAAHAIDARLSVRAEIRAAWARDPRAFSELGIEKVDEDGWTVASVHVAWNAAALDLLKHAASASRPSAQARAGLIHEALARGSSSDKQTALADLAQLVERKVVAPLDAFAAIARQRGEELPAKGYAFRAGRWQRVQDLDAAADSAGLEATLKRFEEATAAQRETALAALEALGLEAAPRVAPALETRWNAALAQLSKGTTLAQLRALADARTDLDLKRKRALDLIFDEQRYFYPYSPPECPPDKARLYPGVQQEVDALVAAVREAWKSAHRVTLGANFRGALDEIIWNRAQQTKRKLSFARPNDLPAWIDALDPTVDAVELSTFAWDAKERAALERDRAVLDLDRRAWKLPEVDAAHAANSEEQKQVEITNDYRRMLGRRVLAWNPKIQAGAQGHSDWMSLTGTFSHEEDTPERRTPADRLKLAGYPFGGAENCAEGDTGAEGAHVGWTHSSGHHRNILDAHHREMASAISGNYWTQNFGSGAEFESQLSK